MSQSNSNFFFLLHSFLTNFVTYQCSNGFYIEPKIIKAIDPIDLKVDFFNVFSISVGARETTGGATDVSQLRETSHVGHQL